VRLEQRVDQVADLVERELAGGVGIEHRRVPGGLAAPGQRGLDREALDVHVRLHQRGEVARQGPDRLRRDAVRARDARHLDAAVAGQVVDPRTSSCRRARGGSGRRRSGCG